MNREFTEIDINAVVVKRRVRQDDGDLHSLTASILKIGLLYPIMIDQHNVLVSGGRRLAACRSAGLGTVPAVRLDVDYTSPEALEIQSDENLCRLPLSAEDLEAHIQLKKSVAREREPGVLSGIKRIFRQE